MKLKINNTNKESMSMEGQAPFNIINHGNFRFDSDSPTVEIIPILKSFFQSLFQTKKELLVKNGKLTSLS